VGKHDNARQQTGRKTSVKDNKNAMERMRKEIIKKRLGETGLDVSGGEKKEATPG